MAVLQTIALEAGYAGRAVARAGGCSPESGAITVLIGANGSGKSTLLRTLTGAQPPVAGRVLLDGRDIASYRPSGLARRLSLVLTDRTGGGGLSVRELAGIGRHPYSGFTGRLSAADRRAVDDAVEMVGLTHKRDAFIASLSDGERQKAMIARALAQDTPLIVLDEPTSFLDVSSRFDIMALLSRLSRECGKTILLSTHDIAPALAVADSLWALAPDADADAATPGPTVLHAGTTASLAASGILDTIYKGMVFDPAVRDFRPALI